MAGSPETGLPAIGSPVPRDGLAASTARY